METIKNFNLTEYDFILSKSLEIIFGIAIIYKRTLILPPRQPWIHISDSKTCCNLEDFYDIDALRTTFPVISAKE